MVTARLECFLEGRSELSIKIRIDQRVEGRVKVAYPEDDGYHHRGAVTHLTAAQGRDDVPETETRGLFSNSSKFLILVLCQLLFGAWSRTSGIDRVQKCRCLGISLRIAVAILRVNDGECIQTSYIDLAVKGVRMLTTTSRSLRRRPQCRKFGKCSILCDP